MKNTEELLQDLENHQYRVRVQLSFLAIWSALAIGMGVYTCRTPAHPVVGCARVALLGGACLFVGFNGVGVCRDKRAAKAIQKQVRDGERTRGSI